MRIQGSMIGMSSPDDHLGSGQADDASAQEVAPEKPVLEEPPRLVYDPTMDPYQVNGIGIT